MEAFHAVLDQVLTLLAGILNAEFSRTRVVTSQLLQFSQQRGGQLGAAEGGEFLDLVAAQHRQHARHQRHTDVQFLLKMVAEGVEIGIVEKQLRDDEFDPGIDLGFQTVPIDFTAFFAGNVPFRETGRANGEAAKIAHKGDQLRTEFKTAFSLLEVTGPGGRIAAQGQNVFNPSRAGIGEHVANLFLGGVDAGEM